MDRVGVWESGREGGQWVQVVDVLQEVGPECGHSRGGPCAEEQENALSFSQCTEA